eukprot:403355671
MEELKEPLIDRQLYPSQSPTKQHHEHNNSELNAQNLVHLDVNRLSTRNHLQQVDDSDTDSVLVQIVQDNQKLNHQNQNIYNSQRKSLFKANATDTQLRDITDNSEEGLSINKQSQRQAYGLKNNQSSKKKSIIVAADSDADLEIGANFRKSLRKTENDQMNTSSSDYSFNEMGDQVQTRRRFQFLWPLFWVLYYLFCCCLFQRRRGSGRHNQEYESGQDEAKQHNRSTLISNFQRTLKKLKSRRFHENYIYDAIRLLQDGKPDGIRNLEKVRINPDFTQSYMIREDLEFFLPQLCCIYLKNEFSKQDQQRFLELLVLMSKSSFHFAHRVLFFINSNINYHSPSQGPKIIEKQVQILSHLLNRQKTLLLAIEEALINGDELLYLSNSSKILETALNQGFKHLYANALSFYDPDIQRKLSPFEIMNDSKIKDQGYQPPKQQPNHKNKHASFLDFKKRTQSMEKMGSSKRKPEILSQINQLILQDSTKLQQNDEDSLSKLSSLQIKLNAYKHDMLEPPQEKTEFSINSFFSTLNFIKDLTDLSVDILDSSDKMQSLKDGLHEINKQLPATVYIPFVSNSTRNHAVLNICVDESRMFLTKERAPFMICVELYRPEEIQLALQDYKKRMKHEMMLEDERSDSDKKLKINKLFQSSASKAKKKEKQKINKFTTKLDQEISQSLAVSQQKQSIRNTHQFLDKGKLSNLSEASHNMISANYIIENSNTGIPITEQHNQTSNLSSNQKIFKTVINNTKMFETEGDEDAKNGLNFNKLLDQADVQNPDQFSILQLSPPVISEKKNSMLYALNSYLKQSNDKLMESRDESNDLNVSKRNFKEEYSFYQNLDKVTDNEHILKSKKEENRKIGKQIMAQRPISTRNQEAQELKIDRIGNYLDDNDIEKGIKSPILEYDLGHSQRIVQKNKKDVIVEQNFLFSETYEQQEHRLRQQSIYGELKTWKIVRMIIKSGDDLRQEQFTMQIISLIDQLFKARKMKCKLKPYEIVATGQGCGVIEFLTDTLSIDFIKRKIIPYGGSTLQDYYMLNYGRKGDKLVQARKNFCYSMAAYSLICHILQIKDRHNANILIDREGHVVHIDFGFLLTHAPGKTFKFERAPFKLTQEFMQVMGGQRSQGFRRFRTHLIEGFYVIHQNADKIMLLVESIAKTQSDLPCFRYGAQFAIDELRSRLYPLTKKMSKGEVAQHIDQLIFQSYDNWGTNVYDRWQYCCQGIF